MKYKNLLGIISCVLWLSACSNSPTPTSSPLQPTLPPAATLPLINTPSPTTVETMIAENELNRMRLAWRQELETTVGFSHPIFETIANRLNGDSFYFRDGGSMPTITQVTFDGATYTAILIDTWSHPTLTDFLMFKLLDSNAELLIDNGGEFVSFNEYHNDDVVITGFADRNGNGYPDIAINFDSSGSAGFGSMLVLEIQSGGEVVNITAETYDVSPRYFVDVDHDGILEVGGYARIYVPLQMSNSARLFVMRYYRWDGTGYRDVSAEHPELYASEMLSVQKGFWRDGFCRHPQLPTYQMLIDYYVMGRLDEGWAWLQPRLGLNYCDQNDMFYYEIKGLMEWVYRLLNGATL